nr:transposase, MuDR, MULE transposase domain protein [Tanacetum cinerariifolium]
MDGNNQIVPIAFDICKGKTDPCWSWWMSVLKECIGDSLNLLFISNRHAAIALAVHNEFPLAFHADVKPDAYHKLYEAGPERWSRAHCPLKATGVKVSRDVLCNGAIMLFRIPCGHILDVTRYLGLTDHVQLVADWFKKEKYQGTYAESIYFLRNMEEWEISHYIQKAIPLTMDNPQPGRLKNTKRIQSQGEEPRVICCSRCSQAGHIRDQCNKPFFVEPPVHTHRQHDQEIPRNEQPSNYNPRQQYDNTFQSYNQYSSQPYGQTTYPSQPYDQHNTNTSQPYDGNHTQSAQMYE